MPGASCPAYYDYYNQQVYVCCQYALFGGAVLPHSMVSGYLKIYRESLRAGQEDIRGGENHILLFVGVQRVVACFFPH